MAVQMPEIQSVIDSAGFTNEQLAIANKIVGRGGRLRSTKPKDDGGAAYVWRMVAFFISPNPQHHCIPIGADFDITDVDYAHRPEVYVPRLETEDDKETVAGWDQKTWDCMNRGAKRRAFIKEELDPIMDKIVDAVPGNRRYGLNRWRHAMFG